MNKLCFVYNTHLKHKDLERLKRIEKIWGKYSKKIDAATSILENKLKLKVILVVELLIT